MRIVPLVIYCLRFETEEEIETTVLEEQRLTHYNPTVIDAAIGYVLAMRYIILNKGNFEGIQQYMENWVKSRKNSNIKQYWDEALQKKLADCDGQTQGWAKHAWSQTFWCLIHLEKFK